MSEIANVTTGMQLNRVGPDHFQSCRKPGRTMAAPWPITMGVHAGECGERGHPRAFNYAEKIRVCRAFYVSFSSGMGGKPSICHNVCPCADAIVFHGESRSLRSTSMPSLVREIGVPGTTSPRRSRSLSSARIRKNPSVNCRRADRRRKAARE